MKINGQKVTSIDTRRTHFDNGCVLVTCGRKDYLMKVSEFLKVINDVEFDVETKKVWEHLTILEV